MRLNPEAPLLDNEQRQSAQDFIKDNSEIVVSTSEIKNLFYELTGLDPDTLPVNKLALRENGVLPRKSVAKPQKISENRIKRKDMFYQDASYITPRKGSPLSHSTPLSMFRTKNEYGSNKGFSHINKENADDSLIQQLYERIELQAAELRSKDEQVKELNARNAKLLEELDSSEEACKSCYTQAKTWEKKFREALRDSKEYAAQLQTIHEEYEQQQAHIVRMEELIHAVEKERKTV